MDSVQEQNTKGQQLYTYIFVIFLELNLEGLGNQLLKVPAQSLIGSPGRNCHFGVFLL